MRTALLLIAMGFGYQIFASAYRQKVKMLQKLGQVVGVVMMVLGFLGAVYLVNVGLRGVCAMKGSCPFVSKSSVPYDMNAAAPQVNKR